MNFQEHSHVWTILTAAMFDPLSWISYFWCRNQKEYHRKSLYTKFIEIQSKSFWNMSAGYLCMCFPFLPGKSNWTSLILSMFPIPHNKINVTVLSKINQKTIFRYVYTLHSQAKIGLFLTSSFRCGIFNFTILRSNSKSAISKLLANSVSHRLSVASYIR